MKKIRKFTAIIEKEGKWYFAHCPELDIASQGKSSKEARKNLKDAITLFFQHASPSEIADKLKVKTTPFLPIEAEQKLLKILESEDFVTSDNAKKAIGKKTLMYPN